MNAVSARIDRESYRGLAERLKKVQVYVFPDGFPAPRFSGCGYCYQCPEMVREWMWCVEEGYLICEDCIEELGLLGKQ